VCKYYCLCYPNSFYTDMVGYMNNHYTKISGLYTWYEKIDANYVYYEFITREKVFWMVIYPDFYNSEALELKKMLWGEKPPAEKHYPENREEYTPTIKT